MSHNPAAFTLSGNLVVQKKQIDCKVSANNTIFTTEANRGRFFPVAVWFHADTITTLGITGPSINVGYTAANYNEFVSGFALPNSSFVTNEFVEVTLRAISTSRLSAPASTAIVARVATASDATAYTGTIFVMGFYVS